jgi:hypothetical protein
VGHVLKCADPLCSACKHELGFAAHEVSPGCVDVLLVGLELNGQHSDVIKLAVSGNLPGQPPVVGVSHGSLQNLEVAPGPSEHMAEPHWQGFGGGIGAGVGLGI